MGKLPKPTHAVDVSMLETLQAIEATLDENGETTSMAVSAHLKLSARAANASAAGRMRWLREAGCLKSRVCVEKIAGGEKACGHLHWKLTEFGKRVIRGEMRITYKRPSKTKGRKFK